jgi:phosphotriesterase-related protein
MAHVQTVSGPVDPSALTGILHHEHLLSLTPGPWLSGGRAGDVTDAAALRAQHDEDQVACAVGALAQLPALGINTVVDLSPYGVVGRDERGGNVALLREIAQRTGLHVVSGTSVYLESFSPAWAREATLDEMTERYLADVSTGIGGTDIRAGVLGEQATGLGVISAHEEKCLRAAARVQRATGLGLVTHTTHGTMALEQLDILREEGVDLSRVVIGHMDTHPETEYVRRVLDSGANVAFDTIGKQYWDFRVAPLPPDQPDGEFGKDAYLRSDRTRAARIATLVAEGYVDQILLAHDLTGSVVYLNPDTHGQWGYAYLCARFTQLLAERGVSGEQLRTMVGGNAARLLTVAD